jgi:hypothetical protein
MPGTVWDTLCYIAGAVAVVGPLFIVYYYFRTVRRRLREFEHRQRQA